jgi:hypothetical protein
MKIILLIIILSQFTAGINAQTKNSILGNIKVTTTPRGAYSPYTGLTPGHESHKFEIRDSVRKTFNVIFNFEEYTEKNLQIKYFTSYVSVSSYLSFEMIPDRKQDESFFVRILMPNFSAEKNFYKMEEYQFKWIAFSELNEKEKVRHPILLIYKERMNENRIEKYLEEISVESLLNPKDELYIIKKMHSITDGFILFTYNIN